MYKRDLSGKISQARTDGELIYGGSENFRFKDFQITSWKNLY